MNMNQDRNAFRFQIDSKIYSDHLKPIKMHFLRINIEISNKKKDYNVRKKPVLKEKFLIGRQN